MQHFAVDLGGRKSQICVREPSGKILREREVATSSLPRILAKEPPSRVVLETCAEAFSMADAALERGHEVRVVPATLVRSLGVGARGIKTDRRDAQVLSEVSTRIDLPSVHIPSAKARDWKSLCGLRQQLVRSRTAFINTSRGWGRSRAIRIPSCTPATFPKRATKAVESLPDGLPLALQRVLDSIEDLNVRIAEADKELASLAKEDDTCKRLMTVPGVGPITAINFAAALDEISRFSSAHAVESYLGLTPGENSSSQRKQRTGITKAGPPAVRTTLIQAAWSLRRARPNDPIVVWAKNIELRRGKFVATVAVARKLAGILFALWRDGTTYESSRAATKT